MANTNCLKGFQCSKCGSLEPFKIEAQVLAVVYDRGTEKTSGTEWSDEAYCECGACCWYGKVVDFKQGEER